MRQGRLHWHGTGGSGHCSPKGPTLGLMFCCCHIEILVPFISGLVFCKWSQWGDAAYPWTEKTHIISVRAVPRHPTHIERFQGPMNTEFWQTYKAWESSKTQSECKCYNHIEYVWVMNNPQKLHFLLESKLRFETKKSTRSTILNQPRTLS